MRKITVILASLVLVMILFSCERTTIVNTKNTFVVERILKHNSRYSKYFSNGIDNKDYHSLIMPTGWYNIGDTIKLMPTKFCKELKEDI